MSPTPGVPPRLQAFPSADAEFVAFVRASWDALSEPRSPAALQQAVRRRYPAAIVTTQHELARHGDEPLVWYAFRVGGAQPEGDGDATAWPAWAILDDDRRFAEVSPRLAEIAELPAEQMVGHRVEEFTNPADPTIREDLVRLWTEFVRRRSIGSTLRFNFRDGTPRELEYRLVADADGPGRHRLSVREVEPRRATPEPEPGR